MARPISCGVTTPELIDADRLTSEGTASLGKNIFAFHPRRGAPSLEIGSYR